eukprot:5119660-Lingulodinium_polyedra.AAC.1
MRSRRHVCALLVAISLKALGGAGSPHMCSYLSRKVCVAALASSAYSRAQDAAWAQREWLLRFIHSFSNDCDVGRWLRAAGRQMFSLDEVRSCSIDADRYSIDVFPVIVKSLGIDVSDTDWLSIRCELVNAHRQCAMSSTSSQEASLAALPPQPTDDD